MLYHHLRKINTITIILAQYLYYVLQLQSIKHTANVEILLVMVS